MLIFRHLFFSLFAFLFAVPAFATIEFRTLSVNDGLSQSTVLAIAQDPLGRIWMGTQDGLNCYDGYSFKVFRHVENDPQSLGDNAISALLADGGRLWIGTSSGLSCYDAATQRFENFRLEGYNMQVSDIARQGDGNLLLATDLGIVLFDRASRSLEIRTYLKGISVHTVRPSRTFSYVSRVFCTAPSPMTWVMTCTPCRCAKAHSASISPSVSASTPRLPGSSQ